MSKKPVGEFAREIVQMRYCRSGIRIALVDVDETAILGDAPLVGEDAGLGSVRVNSTISRVNS
jgi:hypothetical protein